MKVEFSQIFTQIVAFLIMFWILSRFAWKPLLKHLADRRDHIQKEHDDIETQKAKIAKMTKEYEERLKELELAVKEQIQQAVTDGKRKAQSILDHAHQQAKGILIKGEADLKREIHDAKTQMKKELVNMTIAATEKVLGNELEDEQKTDIGRLIDHLEGH